MQALQAHSQKIWAKLVEIYGHSMILLSAWAVVLIAIVGLWPLF